MLVISTIQIPTETRVGPASACGRSIKAGASALARELDRHRKKDKKRKMDSLHEIAFRPRFQKSWFGRSMNWMQLAPSTRQMPTILVVAVEAAEMQYDSIETSEIY
jgi:hypothetical protein